MSILSAICLLGVLYIVHHYFFSYFVLQWKRKVCALFVFVFGGMLLGTYILKWTPFALDYHSQIRIGIYILSGVLGILSLLWPTISQVISFYFYFFALERNW